MSDRDVARDGRRAAIVIAGTGVLWLLALLAGGALGLSPRTLALFDILALVGFGYGLWCVVKVWRARRDQDNRGR